MSLDAQPLGSEQVCCVVGCEARGDFTIEVEGKRAKLCLGHWEAANAGATLALPDNVRTAT